MHELCCVLHLCAGLSSAFVLLCSSIWIILLNTRSVHPDCGIHHHLCADYIHEGSKTGQAQSIQVSGLQIPKSVLDLLATSPGKLVWRAFVASTKGVFMALPHRTVTWAGGVLLALNNCADGGWCCCEVCGFSDFLLWLATHFQDVRPLALLCSALLHCLLTQPFSQVNTCNRERELLISHKYLFISAEGKKVIYVSSCLWQIIKH